MAEEGKKATAGEILLKVWDAIEKGRLASLKLEIGVYGEKSEEIAIKYFERLVEVARNVTGATPMGVFLDLKTLRDCLAEIDAARAEAEKASK